MASGKSLLKPRILAVDDEVFLCEILALNLEDAGFHVTQAFSGNQALQILKNEHFDAIVSDIRMPDGDGIELLNQVRQISPSLHVVLFVSAFANSDVKLAEAYHMGADAFFSKPVSYPKLIEKLRSLLKPRPERWVPSAVTADSDFTVEVSFDDFQAASSARLFNLGRGGFFLKMEGELPQISHRVKFRITFAGGKHSPITGLGICVWRRETDQLERPRGIGVEFLSFDEGGIDSILAVTREFEPIAYIPIT